MGIRLDPPPRSLLCESTRINGLVEEAHALLRSQFAELVGWCRGLIACAGILVLFIVAGWTGLRGSVDVQLNRCAAETVRLDREVERLTLEIESLKASKAEIDSRHNGFVNAQGGFNQRILSAVEALGPNKKVEK